MFITRSLFRKRVSNTFNLEYNVITSDRDECGKKEASFNNLVIFLHI